MNYDEIWRSKELKGIMLRIVSPDKDDSVNVAFDFNHIFPKRTYKYQKWYLEQYYEPTDTKHSWTIDPSLKQV